MDQKTKLAHEREEHTRRYKELITGLIELHDRKDKAYAGEKPLANLMEVEELGLSPVIGVFTRMIDKWSRIKRASRRLQAGEDINVVFGRNKEVEGMWDTLRDMAVYSLLAYILAEDEAAETSAPGDSNDGR